MVNPLALEIISEFDKLSYPDKVYAFKYITEHMIILADYLHTTNEQLRKELEGMSK